MNASQPWNSIPTYMLGVGTSSTGVRYFSSSSRQRSSSPGDQENSNESNELDEQSPTLTHVNQYGTAHMVSVGGKRPTRRTAIAVSSVRFSKPKVLKLIKANAMKKGDVLSVARIAGIMASKNTPSIIPLCHNINITHADVEAGLIDPPPEDWQKTEDPFRNNEDDTDELDDAHDYYNNKESSRLPITHEPRMQMSSLSPGDPAAITDPSAFPHGGVILTARVEAYGPTGVEMDALAAANAAALTVFDMCKSVDRAMSLQNSRVVIKTGGSSGDWVDAGWLYARADVARRKELEGQMVWKGDLPQGEKRGRRWWKKCFRVLVRAGWDRDRAAALLSWMKPATDVAATDKGEGGSEEGGAAVVEEGDVEGEGEEEGASVGEGWLEAVEEADRDEGMPEEFERSLRGAHPAFTYDPNWASASKPAPPSTRVKNGGGQEPVFTSSRIRQMSAQDIFADNVDWSKKTEDEADAMTEEDIDQQITTQQLMEEQPSSPPSEPQPPPTATESRRNRAFGTGRIPPSVEATPEEAAAAQKRPEEPAYPLLQGRQRRRSLARWERDAEWDGRLERLAALERLAELARADAKYSRHWERAVGLGPRAMRKVELAARIGKHDSGYDVLAWEPPGADLVYGNEVEVGDDDLWRSWRAWVKTQPFPAPPPDRGVRRKYVLRHAEEDRRARLKRAMGRADYDEWRLLSFIKGKRERRWESERGLLEGEWEYDQARGEEEAASAEEEELERAEWEEAASAEEQQHGEEVEREPASAEERPAETVVEPWRAKMQSRLRKQAERKERQSSYGW